MVVVRICSLKGTVVLAGWLWKLCPYLFKKKYFVFNQLASVLKFKFPKDPIKMMWQECPTLTLKKWLMFHPSRELNQKIQCLPVTQVDLFFTTNGFNDCCSRNIHSNWLMILTRDKQGGKSTRQHQEWSKSEQTFTDGGHSS